MSSNKNHTTVFPTVTTIPIGTRTYRTGVCFGGFFVKEVQTGAYLHFYSQKSRDHFLQMVARAAGDTDFDPTPTPAAAMLRVLPQVTVPACCAIKQFVGPSQDRNVNKEHAIRIPAAPTKVVGEFYPDNFTLSALIGEFESKHGVTPTRIAFNDTDDTYRFAEFAGIPVVKSRTVPSRQIHLMFDPAKAEAGQS
jgi:hypothetical protein